MSKQHVDKRLETGARNKMQQYRFKRDTGAFDDEEPQADLSEALQLGGFKAFNLGEIRTLPEVIRPLLSYFDSQTLASVEKQLEKECVGFQHHQKSLPLNLFDDLFNLFFIPSDRLKFVESTMDNSWRIFLLQNLSHYYMRVLTEQNNFNSFIVARELAKMLLDQLNPPNKNQKPPEPSKTGNPFGKVFGNGIEGLQNMRDEALDKAQKIMDDATEAGEAGGIPTGDEAGGGKQAGKDGSALSAATDLAKLLEQLGGITISKQTLNQFIKQSLNLSSTYFSSYFHEEQEELFEADEITELDGVENLLPHLQAIGLEDITTTHRVYHTGFDVYLDRSGSMSASVGERGTMQGFDLVKLTACALLNKGLVRNIYFFDTQISENHDTTLKVMQARTGGGTNTEMVIRQIKETGCPALILTDMCDTITTFTPLAYFVGVCGAQMYSNDTGKRYLKNGQFSTFDGKVLKLVKP